MCESLCVCALMKDNIGLKTINFLFPNGWQCDEMGYTQSINVSLILGVISMFDYICSSFLLSLVFLAVKILLSHWGVLCCTMHLSEEATHVFLHFSPKCAALGCTQCLHHSQSCPKSTHYRILSWYVLCLPYLLDAYSVRLEKSSDT